MRSTLFIFLISLAFVQSIIAGDAHPNFSADDQKLVFMSGGEIKVVEPSIE